MGCHAWPKRTARLIAGLLWVIVGHRPAGSVGDAQGRKLAFQVAHAAAEDEPSSAELVHIGGEVGGVGRVPVRDHDDAGAELDLLRLRGQPSQIGEGFIVGGWVQL